MAPHCEALFEASLQREDNTWTQDTLSGLPTCKGVLLFADTDSRPIQLLQAASLRRTAQAKLLEGDAEEGPSRKTDISELTGQLYFTSCANAFESTLTYIRLVHALFPGQTADWLQLPSPVFAVLDSSAALPCFTVSSNPVSSEQRQVFGLFGQRKTAGLFCETLNTVFGLCRNRPLLGSGNEASCPYLQMQTCGGPCIGQLNMETYRQFVQEALDAANGELDEPITKRTTQMKAAAQSMHYERAKRLKDQIDALASLKERPFQWTENLNRLAVLHVDRAGKVKVEGRRKRVHQYAGWKITARGVFAMGTFELTEANALERFIREQWDTQTPVAYAETMYEHLATSSLFLFRHNVQGLWLNGSQGVPASKQIEKMLVDIFPIETPEPAEE